MPCGKKPPLHPGRPRPSYGEGLQQLPPYAASSRKDILEKIKKADPEDTKGVHFKSTFNHLPYIEKVQRMVNDSAKDGGPKDYKTAHAYVNKQLKIPGLTAPSKTTGSWRPGSGSTAMRGKRTRR